MIVKRPSIILGLLFLLSLVAWLSQLAADEKVLTDSPVPWEHTVVVFSSAELDAMRKDAKLTFNDSLLNSDIDVADAVKDAVDSVNEAATKGVKRFGAAIEKKLNEHGDHGWQVATAGEGWVIFKRKKTQLSPDDT